MAGQGIFVIDECQAGRLSLLTPGVAGWQESAHLLNWPAFPPQDAVFSPRFLGNKICRTKQIGAKGETMRVTCKERSRTEAWLRKSIPWSRFVKSDAGSITVEFVLWTPILFGFLLMVADVSLAFMQKARLLDISREAARIVARHGLDETGAESFAFSQARMDAQALDVSVEIDPEENTVTVTLFVGIEDIAPLGFLRSFQTERVVIQTVNVIEPI